MQTKTIRKNIQNKMNEWLSTIIDEKLRTSVKNSLLVSGGCIASMFLNEEVNDYDIYIEKYDILLELIQYYAVPYGNIEILEGKNKYSILSRFFDGTEHQSMFASMVRNLKDDQIKLYIKDDGGGFRVNNNIKEDDLKYVPVFFSPNAISLSNNIQIVLRFHGDAKEIHKNFDFIHATNYFTFKDGLVTNKEAVESILTKQLKYLGSLYPLTSILRMKKFVKRDWNINAGEVLKIMLQISELNLKDPDILEEQLIGIDVAYFSEVIRILRSVNIENHTSHYINTIIDRVFNDSEEASI